MPVDVAATRGPTHRTSRTACPIGASSCGMPVRWGSASASVRSRRSACRGRPKRRRWPAVRPCRRARRSTSPFCRPPTSTRSSTFTTSSSTRSGRPVFKRRGGFATLAHDAHHAADSRTRNAPCSSTAATASRAAPSRRCRKVEAIVPLMNLIGYDLVLPGNWEVVYGKDMLIKDMGMYTAAQRLREHVPCRWSGQQSCCSRPTRCSTSAARGWVSSATTIRSRRCASRRPTRRGSASHSPRRISHAT